MHNQKQKAKTLLAFVVMLSVAAAVFVYEPLWNKISNFRQWSLGLDIAGGSYLIYEVDTSQLKPEDKTVVLNGLRDVIEKRVNLFGVSEPRVFVVQNENANRLIVELAGIKDVKEAIKEIGATPFLDFREVVELSTTTANTDDSAVIETSTEEPKIGFIPTDLNGRYVKTAQLGFDDVSGKPLVSIEFNSEGAKIFAELTERNVKKPLAIFLDNQLIEMPIVQEKIQGGRAQISGNFTIDTARKLVERFNAGALPAPVNLINQNTISPELGADSLRKAILAGAIGTCIVILFMLGYYKKLGIFAALALLMYVFLTLAVFKLMPVTMTLAGIAGFILSIGMAVDANILVFERTKEELKRGLSVNSAIENGFKRAWTSIRDSNISTIISALMLYYFTSSFVKGFALTLLIGVIVSMFSAITITRTMLRIFYKSQT